MIDNTEPERTENFMLAVALALIALISIGIIVLGVVTALAEALPYTKGSGQCAGSYVQSGSYCVPKSGGTLREAVPKPRGASCPSGWRQSGDACEKAR
jgi:hypothetical protein